MNNQRYAGPIQNAPAVVGGLGALAGVLRNIEFYANIDVNRGAARQVYQITQHRANGPRVGHGQKAKGRPLSSKTKSSNLASSTGRAIKTGPGASAKISGSGPPGITRGRGLKRAGISVRTKTGTAKRATKKRRTKSKSRSKSRSKSVRKPKRKLTLGRDAKGRFKKRGRR